MAEAKAAPPLPELAPLAGSAEYERWLLAEPPPEGGYLFSEARVRFEARDQDPLVPAPGLVCERTSDGVSLALGSRGISIRVAPVDSPSVAHLLELLDGERAFGAACREAGVAPGDRARLVGAAFGIVLFAPRAVAELEAELPSAELVRFPGAPYELDRNYWANMVDVRRGLPELERCLEVPLAALRELMRLHGRALMGASGRSFYRPASPIAAKGVHPGRLWNTATRLAESADGLKFLSGPRVNASLLGGEHYAALIAELSGDPEALAARRDHVDSEDLGWGQVVTARAEHDTGPAPWFCPPRPLTERHFQSLFESFARATAAAGARDREATVLELADFQQKFVRLHPFRAANQSLAMNLVNGVLTRVTGAGMPHLILDQLALRLSPAAYRRLFALAVEHYAIPGSPIERYRKLAARKARWFALIESLQTAHDLDQARLIAAGRPEDSRLALLDL